VPKRSPYDKTQYIEDYVPNPGKYHHTRKPRLAQWDDPNVHWPKLLPKVTKLEKKELIRSVEDRERVVIERQRNFRIPVKLLFIYFI
jgi:hypothetical protein